MISKISVEVSSETYAFGQLLAKFVATSAVLIKQGFTLQTVPAELVAVLADLLPALQKVQALAPEEKENPKAFATALELCVNDMVVSLLA